MLQKRNGVPLMEGKLHDDVNGGAVEKGRRRFGCAVGKGKRYGHGSAAVLYS
jgi:hypothetical protein